MDLPFQFNPANAHLKDLTVDMLDLRSGESLAIESMLGLHALVAEDDRVDAHFGANKSNSSVKECKQMGRSIPPKNVFPGRAGS